MSQSQLQFPLVLLLGFVLSLASACKNSDGPDCAKVSAHFISLVRGEMAKQGSSAQNQTAQANLPTLQNALLEACESKKWSVRTRTCVLEARTAAETKACDPAEPLPSPTP